MADTIRIPSPSVFLRSPIPQSTAKPASKNPHKRGASSASKGSTSRSNDPDAVTKPKQSKSRNGCITCKVKRLKCDETKPSCQQCAKRSVNCGGYKKDFKWRPFEEASFSSKPALGRSRKVSPSPTSASVTIKCESPASSDTSNTTIGRNPHLHGFPGSTPPPRSTSLSLSREQSFNSPSMSDTVSTISNTDSFMLDPSLYPNHEGDARHVTFAMADELEPSSVSSTFSMFDDATTLQSTTTAPSSLSSGQSPRLMDLVMPGSDLTAPSTEYVNFRSQHPDSLYQPCQPSLIIQRNGYMDEDDDVEEVVRQTYVNPDHEAWIMRLPSPLSSGSSSGSSEGSPTVTCWNTFDTLYREPVYSNDSPEMLMLRFDRQTCGILSVKDGPTENPWRTLIWPLARDCSALYHAIASMTSFHTSRDIPSMRVQGIHHMRSSIKSLVSGIQNMRFDTAIATTLVLAFAESWDQHISTGINHIKGAKILVNQALVQHRQASFSAEDTARLRFLCNTWVYMDVIARLTSVDDDESNDFDNVYEMMSPEPLENDMQLDPLMGCASTLFPVVGRVANLVRRVRRSESNSPAIISKAVDLRRMLEAWIPPSFVEPPEDPTSEIQHSLQTAEAYRWATLLYLHQAVPEIPYLSSADLSKKVLEYLATVPLSSRAIIVHIYPLLAAGAEANNEEDRRWVADRWQSMGRRMAIGVIDRCADVLKEVWSRRDAYEMSGQSCLRMPVATTCLHSSMLKRNYTVDEAVVDDPFDWIDSYGGGKRRAASGGNLEAPRALRLNLPRPRRSSADFMTGVIDPQFSVRGRLHWLGVMKDWGWEVLLG